MKGITAKILAGMNQATKGIYAKQYIWQMKPTHPLLPGRDQARHPYDQTERLSREMHDCVGDLWYEIRLHQCVHR